MPAIEKSGALELELKDLDTNKRTAVIKHAVYTSIDRVGDISTQGMFTKSWQENKSIDFLFNHKEGQNIGSVKSTYEDDSGAYTEVKFGNWTLGNDVLEMASEGILKGASFGYITEKKDFVNIKGKKIRKLREVKHVETSLLTVMPAHPEAGIITLNKAFDELDLSALTNLQKRLIKQALLNDIELKSALPITALYNFYNISEVMPVLEWNSEEIKSMKNHIEQIEDYCQKAKASDETIRALQYDIFQYKQIISDYDTATTHVAIEPVSSDDEIKSLNNFITSLNLESWQKKHLMNSS